MPARAREGPTCRVGRVFLRPARRTGRSRENRDPGEADGTAEIICTASAKRAGVMRIRIDPSRRALRACLRRVMWIDGSGLNPRRPESDRHACPGQGRPRPLAEWAGCSYARPGDRSISGEQGSRRSRWTRGDHLHGKREARGVMRIRIDPSRRALRACLRRVMWIDGSGLNPRRSESDRHACPGQGRPRPPAEWAGVRNAG